MDEFLLKRGQKGFVCQCRLCVRGREFDRRVKRLSPDSRAFFEALYDSLNYAEFELDMHKLDKEQAKRKAMGILNDG